MKYLNGVERSFFIIMGILVIILVILLIAMIISPSCSEQGGHLVVNGYTFTFIYSGKVLIPIQTPLYECIIPK